MNGINEKIDQSRQNLPGFIDSLFTRYERLSGDEAAAGG
jgi:hypothetical protein